MARTLIGELLLRLKDEMSGKAKTAAGNVSTSINEMQAAAKKLNNTHLGGGFMQQLQRLKASAKDLNAVKNSWHNLNSELVKSSMAKAFKANQLSRWRAGVIGDLAAVRREADRLNTTFNQVTAEGGKPHKPRKPLKPTAYDLKRLGKVAAGAVGVGATAYGAPVLGTRAIEASAEQERERFRESMMGISPADQGKIFEAAQKLSTKYRAASQTEIMEMARTATSTMGSVERGLQVLETMVKGLVTLKSTKGVDAGGDELNRMLRGIDNLGANAAGDLGIKQVSEIIDGMVHASQIEGQELDVGKLFDFARRAKIAGPGLSNQFISTTAPAMFSDFTPEGYGSALSSAYQAFVIGSNAVASKDNIKAQRNLGLRTGEGKGELVDANLFGTDPYQWVKANLIPALQKSGVDMKDETAVAKAVAGLSRNTNATGLLTRMVTQQSQIDRLIEQYQGTKGIDAADTATQGDPFVAYDGFKSSLENLSAATVKMPVITTSLNSLSDMINRLAEQAKDNKATGNVVAGGAVAAGGIGAYLAGSTLWGGLKSLPGNTANVAALIARFAPWLSLLSLTGDTENGGKKPWHETPGSQMTADFFGQRYNQRQETNKFYKGSGPTNPRGDAVSRFSRTHKDIEELTAESARAGQAIQSNLNVTASPKIDNTGLRETVSLADQAIAKLNQIGAIASDVTVRAQRNFEMHIRQSYTDFGGEPSPF